MNMVLLTLGFKNDGNQLLSSLLTSSKVKLLRNSVCLCRQSEPDRVGKQIAAALWHSGLGISMTKAKRWGPCSTALDRLCSAVAQLQLITRCFLLL